MIAPLLVAAAAFALQSTAFKNGATIPTHFKATACGGDNASPALAWSGAPAAAKSIALVAWDPDAPIKGGFYHWLIYNLPAETRAIAEGKTIDGARMGRNSDGAANYYGPCPPDGPAHHYVFTLYALDVEKIGGDAPLDADAFAAAIRGHVVAKTTLIATASH